MDPLEQIMHHWSNRAQTPKKRWRTVCRNDAEGGLQAQKRQQQAPLRRWIRPSTWMTTPLDLDPDVSSLIVEALMRERDVATIQSFALVSRACAASVTTTLQTTRARLRQAATRVANAERGVHIWCGRAAREEARQEWLEQPGPPWPDDEENLEGRYMDHYNDDLSDREADEIDRMESLRDAFYEQMKRVGIPFDRRNALAKAGNCSPQHAHVVASPDSEKHRCRKHCSSIACPQGNDTAQANGLPQGTHVNALRAVLLTFLAPSPCSCRAVKAAFDAL